jgi:hypothetical protein
VQCRTSTPCRSRCGIVIRLDLAFVCQAFADVFVLQVYSSIRASVQPFVTGRDVCVVACGETESGKTYTMFGSSDAPGVVLQAIKDSVSSIGASGAKLRDVNLAVSMLDLTSDTFVDLLADSSDRGLAIDTHLNENVCFCPSFCSVNLSGV